MNNEDTTPEQDESVKQTETTTETPDGTTVEQKETEVTSTQPEGKTNQPDEGFTPQVVSANDVIDEANEKMQGGSAEDN